MAEEESERPHAVDIYERVCEDSQEELERLQSSIVFSGLFAGFAIGLAPLAAALATVSLGSDVKSTALIAALLYPIGYVAVIIGRAQFFTENTLYPVMLSLRHSEFIGATARLWGIVYSTNLLGAFLFAALVVLTGALADDAQLELVKTGVDYASDGFSGIFFSAVITGFLLALVAWLVEGSDTVTARIAVIWGLTFLVALGSFDHCIASTLTTFAALLEGELGLGKLLAWLAPATLGNIAGGVLIVTSINYGQVRGDD